jgi:hypothetical protein
MTEMDGNFHPSGRIGKTDGEFSVCQFFKDGTYEYVRRWVGAEEAVKTARHYCQCPAADLGIVVKVIITDGGDCTNFCWMAEDGLVFPTPERSAPP